MAHVVFNRESRQSGVELLFTSVCATQLASGEVPGLFEGDEHTLLMQQCREAAQRHCGANAEPQSEQELWRSFTQAVQRNLHVVFTMNPTGADWQRRSATSPALFNRCVVDWFGQWSRATLLQ
eukprot:7380542-Prymnesium_polylepis.1